MNKKLLLAGLMVSAMGFSSLFAVEDEDVNVKSEQCRSCGCNNSEKEKQCISCDCTHDDEEEVKGSLVSEEEVTTRAISCEGCRKQSNEEEIKESLVG